MNTDLLPPIAMAIGLFVGNWLIVPPMLKLFGLRRSFSDGFYIGLLAAILVLVFYSMLLIFK